jgi:carbamoyl-phosphate synthase / aspartate carbamoyltransferase
MKVGVERDGVLDVLKGKVLCTIFYEPSTRTSCSFDAAMKRLGGQTVTVQEHFSSTSKGESLADTIRTLACYGDAIVLRHPEESSAETAARYASVPVINAGNGAREHPTQAFLDLFTMREELGTVNGLCVTFVGDLRHGRTVHSLCVLLRSYDDVKVNLVAPASLALPRGLRRELEARDQLGAEAETLTPEIVAGSDVLYVTRTQKERFASADEYEAVKDALVVDNKVLRWAKSKMVVMHPLPRNNEIAPEVDWDLRAAYFRQVRSCSLGERG